VYSMLDIQSVQVLPGLGDPLARVFSG